MNARSDRLNRLVISSPCHESWDGMAGLGASRHCERCNRQVHDFATRTPPEIAKLIAAHHGRLCARLTHHRDGRLVTLPLPRTSSIEVTRRVSPFAAAMVAGLLGVPGAATAQAPATAPAAETPERETAPGEARVAKEPAAVSLFGRVTDGNGQPVPGVGLTARNTLDGDVRWAQASADGHFVFTSLGSGVYEVSGQLAGWEIGYRDDILLSSGERREISLTAQPENPHVTAGVLIATPDPLRQVFSRTPLVVVAMAGESVALDPEEYAEDGEGEVRTELHLIAAIKGEPTGASVFVERYGSADPEVDGLSPGTELLAFLEPSGEGTWEPADYGHGLMPMEKDAMAAYRERLTALAALEPGAPGHAAELLEWIVATTANPLTRSGAVGELGTALGRLDRLAEERGTSVEHAAEDLRGVTGCFLNEGGTLNDEPREDLLAALLTDAQRARLTRALEATEKLEESDLDLYRLVYRWAPARATTWLAHRFRTVEIVDLYRAASIVHWLAEDLPGAHFPALAKELDDLDYDQEGAKKDVVRRFRRALVIAGY